MAALRWPAVAALAVTLLATGCTTMVAGTVTPAPGLVPVPVTGKSVRQVLLDDAELSQLFDQKFGSDPAFPPRFGGTEELPDGWVSAAPDECVGTVVGTQKNVYGSLDVRDLAHEFWAGAPGGPVNSLAEGVIALPTAAVAQAAFEKFAEQWRRCDGVTVTRYTDGVPDAAGQIADVVTGDSVLTATVQTGLPDKAGIRVARALGLRVNCLVDVDIFLADGVSADTRAADLARVMMDKISVLATSG